MPPTRLGKLEKMPIEPVGGSGGSRARASKQKEDGSMTSGAPRPLKFSISGFPEYLPEHRQIEQRWLGIIEQVFQSYGYVNIETPSVEKVATLAEKGEDVDKEIYALARLNPRGEGSSDAKLALHYDLTVPFARYVADHQQNLSFPFKRYQSQRVWRGERPQEGRYREFTQCDIDVVGNGSISDFYDGEMLEVVMLALERLEVGPILFQISSRKLLQGLGEALGVVDVTSLARLLDKIGKLTEAVIHQALVDNLGLSADDATTCLSFASIKGDFAHVVARLKAIGVGGPSIEAGLAELRQVVDHVGHAQPASFRLEIDLSIARGFDYYTGVVYEARFIDYPKYPSICAGGRYENLVSSFAKKSFPGVGVSIGLTRIFTKLLSEGQLLEGRPSPTDVLITRLPESDAGALLALARDLRERGMKVEVFADAPALDKQIKYASRKKIPYVLFPFTDGHQVKALDTGVQSPFDGATFSLGD